MEASDASESFEAGWYDYDGGKRYYDGQAFTEHFAYVPEPQKQLGFGEVLAAVVFGMLIAWGLIYLGSQLSPDHIYWPVKFVVKELPNFGGFGQ
jgi:hypothetical protein